MNIWRLHLKPGPIHGITFENVLNFCKDEQIIGVGWFEVTCKTDDKDVLHSEVYNLSYDKDKKASAFKAINAMRQMKPGDLIWTRLGQDASEYYLCQVGDKLWKDRIITQRHRDHDVCQFVSASWVKIGKIDHVPGKVVNSFNAQAAVQRVNDVTDITKHIWNMNCGDASKHYSDISDKDFWNAIGSEDLECLVLLYLQSLGNYIYSSTLKKGTAKYETVMVSSDAKMKLYPQVKRNEILLPINYTKGLNNNEKAVLFTTSQNYGDKQYDNAICLTKAELEEFIRHHEALLPDSVKYWLKMTNYK